MSAPFDLFSEKTVTPMLLMRGEPTPDEQFVYELKFDGIRAIAYLDEGMTMLRGRKNNPIHDAFPELNDLHLQIRDRVIVDGEIVCFQDGKPSFQTILKRIRTAGMAADTLSLRYPAHFVAFDLLYLNGNDLTALPLLERKQLLSTHLKESGSLILSRYTVGGGSAMLEFARSQALEGIVAKRKDSPYRIGERSQDWLKIKNWQEEDFDVLGFRQGEDGSLRAVAIGVRENGGDRLQGRVGGLSRFDKQLLREFAQSHRAEPPQKAETPPEYHDFYWLPPGLRAKVEYMHVTEGGNYRQPILKCLYTEVSEL